MIAVNDSQETKSDVALNLSQSTQPPWKLSSELKCSLYVLYTLISSFGISGNIAVCYILGIKKKRKRRFDILLISLAFADLLALISGSVTMIGDLAGDLSHWYFGSFLCQLLPSIAPVTLFVSSWTLVVISFDRYQVMRRRRRAELSLRVIALQLAAVWILAVSMTFPYMVGSQYENSQCLTVPLWPPHPWVMYVGFWIITGWGVPLLMIGIFYCLVLRSLSNGLSEGCHLTILQKRLKRNKDILSMFIVIVCVFFLLTTPYAAFYFSATYLMLLRPQSIDHGTAQQVNYALFTLMMVNSSINPVIYAKLHKEVNMFVVRYWKRFTDQLRALCCPLSSPKIVVYEMAAERGNAKNQSSMAELCRHSFSTERSSEKLQIKYAVKKNIRKQIRNG
ncbi:neuromedin-K receptor-like isoform X2 [Rhopilema esculentum]|uniref:neuromedin-K receptor-like isoform X2 n=1 Tax=Rhopilema esculentum TaxID=499914 RepID=UPI0031D01F39